MATKPLGILRAECVGLVFVTTSETRGVLTVERLRAKGAIEGDVEGDVEGVGNTETAGDAAPTEGVPTIVGAG
jgi:hypothetical protein